MATNTGQELTIPSKAPSAAPREDDVRASTIPLAAPVAVLALDVQDLPGRLDLGRSRSGAPYRGLHAVLMRDGWPIGTVDVEAEAAGAVDGEALRRAASTVTPPPVRTEMPNAPERPRGTVVVTTCDNPQPLLRCLSSILEGLAPDDRVVVVENRPRASSVAAALRREWPDDGRIDYVEEERAGLGRARNAGLAVCSTPLVAFTDDDVVADAAWSARLFGALATEPDAAVVTGLIAPLALETPSQLLLERFAGFGKGFERRVHRLATPPPDDPLFPYAAGTFGSGANLACRTDRLVAMGGFDPVLGTGTRARGGEDLDLFTRTLLAGHALVYEPGAIVWHEHPDTPERLRRQAFGYGAGLGAAITKAMVCGPRRSGILRRVPAAARHMLAADSPKNARKGPAYPRALTVAELAGLAAGPVGYLRSRLEARRTG